MEKTSNEKKEEAERRRDLGRRLQTAVRRAHDPLFTPFKPPPEKRSSEPDSISPP